MRKSVLAASVFLLATATSPGAQASADRFWAQWRGPDATGVARFANPPVEWNEKTNIRWKIEIPGRGSASPVVWGDRIFVLTAIPAGVPVSESHTPQGGFPTRAVHRFVVLAIDRNSGKVVWERTAREEAPHEASHPDNGTWASSSAVTDGQQVFAFFESRGLFAYDMDGKLLWQKDFGHKRMRNQFGEGTTPALHGNRLVLVWDHQGESFITVLDKRTGDEVWRARREEIDSWATPLVLEHAGRTQVIVSGMNRLRSYDLETGEIVWHSDGLTMNPIHSPVAADGMVFATSGFAGGDLKAVRIADARGNIDGTSAIAWSLNRDTPYVPSPLLYGGVLYLLKTNSGILSAFDARTGTPHYQLQRLPKLGEVFSSPVAAEGRIYITGRDGTTLVIRQGPKLEVLATNTLDDGFDASAALVDNEIILRGYKSLYSIGTR